LELTLLTGALNKRPFTSGRFFGISEDKVVWLNFAGIGLYKLAILFFNFAPYIALHIMAVRK
jgi:hypothetical protein